MTDCNEIRPLLSAYLDGEAAPHELAVIEAHLPGCDACAAALAGYDALGALGAALEIAGVAAVTATLTLFIVEPYLRNLDFHRPATAVVQLASRDSSHSAPPADETRLHAVMGNLQDADTDAALDSQELMSALGGGVGPSIAVWNEPRSDTTVVWVPDQR